MVNKLKTIARLAWTIITLPYGVVKAGSIAMHAIRGLYTRGGGRND